MVAGHLREKGGIYYIVVAGHLREKGGIYYIVLSYTDEYGNRRTPSQSTGLPVKGNKKRAEDLLQRARHQKEEELKCRRLAIRSGMKIMPDQMRLTEYLKEWLKMMRTSVEMTTYDSYERTILNRIIPYFNKRYPKLLLQELTPKQIQDYYTYELDVCKVSPNTVIHRHANLRKALQYAFRTGLLDNNPADRVQRPRKERYQAHPYNGEELEVLFEKVKGTNLELGVILAAFYGLRRSEACGLKWSAIDFTRKTITISHTVSQVKVDGKITLVGKDRTKTKSSHRTLPLVGPFEELLLAIRDKQEANRRICGNCYCQEYLDYVYVNGTSVSTISGTAAPVCFTPTASLSRTSRSGWGTAISPRPAIFTPIWTIPRRWRQPTRFCHFSQRNRQKSDHFRWPPQCQTQRIYCPPEKASKGPENDAIACKMRGQKFQKGENGSRERTKSKG